MPKLVLCWLPLVALLSLIELASTRALGCPIPQQRKRLNQQQLRSLAKQGFYELANEYDDKKPYRIRQNFLDEAERHFVLGAPVPITVPVRLLHGLKDIDVPWERSMILARLLESEDVVLHLVKHGDHRLSKPGDLRLLINTLEQLLSQGEQA